jgi:hypothetical protein
VLTLVDALGDVPGIFIEAPTCGPIETITFEPFSPALKRNAN